MSALKRLFNIDLDVDLYIKSAKFVMPNHLVKVVNKNSAIVENIRFKFENLPPYKPKEIDLDTIKNKFIEYNKQGGRDLFNSSNVDFTFTELKKICYYVDYFIDSNDDYLKMVHLLGSKWEELGIKEKRFLRGLIFYLLSNWESLEKNIDSQSFNEFILDKIIRYKGEARNIIKIQRFVEYLKYGGAAKFGAYLKSNKLSISDAPLLLGLNKMSISYSYFSKVIEAFYHKANSIDENLEMVLSSHNSSSTSKRVLARFIIEIDKNNDVAQQNKVTSLALKLVGNPSSTAAVGKDWSSIGFEPDIAQTIDKARKILNHWLMEECISIFFDKVIVDPDRKKYWLKYVDEIDEILIIGSKLNKNKLAVYSSLTEDILAYYFKLTTREYGAKTCAIAITIGEYLFVEFSDVGALYVYHNNDSIKKKLKVDVKLEKASDLKITSYNKLIDQINDMYNLYDEGRMVHVGHWQKRLDSWFKIIMKIDVNK